jgi:hypothetical protein
MCSHSVDRTVCMAGDDGRRDPPEYPPHGEPGAGIFVGRLGWARLVCRAHPPAQAVAAVAAGITPSCVSTSTWS